MQSHSQATLRWPGNETRESLHDLQQDKTIHSLGEKNYNHDCMIVKLSGHKFDSGRKHKTVIFWEYRIIIVKIGAYFAKV